MKKSLQTILTILAMVILNSQLSAQDVIKIERVNGQIRFDGVPDEALWDNLTDFKLVMHRPNYMSQPSERTEVKMGYDDEFIWVGARLYMNDATKIFAATKRRDEMLFDYDAFGIILDSYDDNENGFAFHTTPTGSRTDYSISNDGMGGGGPSSSINTSWNTFWDVKTTRDDKGWYAEMRIPFSSLRFKPENDAARMGLIITRIISANAERDSYPAIDPKYGFSALNKPSVAQTIEFSGARPTRPVYISPYAISGFSRSWELNDMEDSYEKNDKPVFNAGIDVKYNINSNITLDLTANTDFAQVEADDQQVNLTRYSLFFPEKRMFFQERSNLFSFSLGGRSDNLFYSRNIGISRGNQVKILGGARLAGRIGNWDMGLLNMQTEEYGSNPSENFGVLRLRRQVINPNSYVGGMVTSRLGMNGDANMAYGLDGIFRLFGDDYLNVKWAQSYDNGIDTSMSVLDPSFILLNWEKRSEEGFAYSFNYTYAGEQFMPGSGFLRTPGVHGLNGQLLYGWIHGEESKIFNSSIFVRGARIVRVEDGGLESMTIEPGFEISMKSDIRIELGIEHQREGVARDFRISDSILVTSGEYSFTGMSLRASTPDSKKIALRTDVEAGQFYDGKRYGAGTELNLNLSSSFQISSGYEFNALRFNDRPVKTSLNIHSINSRAIYMLSTKLSASLLVQYVNTEDELITNFRVRYNPREGNDFYLVFNEFRSIRNNNEIPSLPSFFNRTVMVKYTHTFIL